MAQRNDLAEKAKLLWDGEEIPGLVSISPTTREKGVIEVPEFRRIRKIQNGITTFSEQTLVYKIQKDSKAHLFWKSFFANDESHDAVHIRCDASGTEFARVLWQSCECTFLEDPEVDLGGPTYAKVTVRVVPFEIIDLAGES